MKRHWVRILKFNKNGLYEIEAINPNGKHIIAECEEKDLKKTIKEISKNLMRGFMAPDLIENSYYLDPGVI